MPGPILDTPRLVLRPVTLADVDVLHRMWSDPDVRRYLWDDVVIAREQAAAVVEASLESFGRRGFGQWLAGFVTGDDAIGFCGLRETEDGAAVEVLYGFRPAYWGQGFATEAAVAVLRHGFEMCGLARILGRTDPPNLASRRLLERVGMRRDEAAPGPLVVYALERRR